MIVLSHPTGSEFVRQAVTAFDDAGILGEFWTTLSWNPDGIVHRLLPLSLRSLLNRRSYPTPVRSRTRTVPLREIGRLLGGVFSMDAVSIALDKKVAARLRQIENCKLVYAYEDAALQTFRAAAERGIARIYDLPIGYWRTGQRIFTEEMEREPEWASTLTGMRDSEEKLARKDEELTLADVVITPSRFSKESLARATSLTAPVEIIPYGTNPSQTIVSRPQKAGKLRVLFVGALTQAKGLGYLLEAAELVRERIELTLIGHRVSAEMPRQAMLEGYRWIPSLSHADLLEEMARHDVLVLPSLNEGFGLVLAEAMAQRLTVIATPHTAGPDLFTNGMEGFLVPIRSAEAIAEKLLLLDGERDRLAGMQEAARRRAMTNSWENYRQRLIALAQEVVARSPVS